MDAIYSIPAFLSDTFLSLTWLKTAIEKILIFANLDPSSQSFAVISFFLYDVIKIFYLLVVLIFAVSYIQSYFPPHRISKLSKSLNGLKGSGLCALLGILTPFCSCSSIPLFISMTSAGLRLGMTITFLIMSPLADLGSLSLILAIFGWKFAIIYIFTGFIISVASGMLIDHFKMERYLTPLITDTVADTDIKTISLSNRQRFNFAYETAFRLLKKVWPYIVLGVGAGAFIHNFIPENYIVVHLGPSNPFSVVMAVLAGAPLYADIFGAVPVAQALLEKGAGAGTVIAFLMSVTALSVPAMVMLRQAMKPRLLCFFILVVIIGIIINGLIFNLVL